MSILWGGKKWRPSSPVRRQPINQSIEELMKPLGEKTFKGNVWGSVIMKVPEAQTEPTPTPTPTQVTPTPTPTQTSTPTPTLTSTPTPTVTSTSTPTPTVTSTSTPTPTPSAVPPSNTFITGVTQTASSSSFTFSNVPIGGDGLIVVAISSKRNSNVVRNFAGATIGGSSATTVIAGNGSFGGNTPVTAIVSRRMTGGATTATIAVSFDNTMDACSISVYRIQNNVSDTAHKTGVNANGSSTTSVTLTSVTAGAIGVASACINDTGGGLTTWTNATERYDVYNATADGTFTSASLSLGGGNQTITSAAAGDVNVTAAAVWL
jgi:hypothetical protein